MASQELLDILDWNYEADLVLLKNNLDNSITPTVSN